MTIDEALNVQEREKGKWGRHDVHAALDTLAAEVRALQSENDRLRKALEEIERDRINYADAQLIAREALKREG